MKLGLSPDNSSPVISLCIFDEDTLDGIKVNNASRLLVVVRDPKTNITHPNVISVPTQRIPKSLIENLAQQSKQIKCEGSTICFEENWVSSDQENGHNPLIFLVKSVLANKLGVSEKLERGFITYKVALQSFTTGKSEYPNLLPPLSSEEYIQMASVIVILKGGQQIFPSKTACYSKIFWTTVKDFIDAVNTKDNSYLPIRLNPIDYCIHGLCISSTYEYLTKRAGL